MKTGKLLLINFTIFIGLIIGTILFEFLFLGYGASANSPNFKMDTPLLTQLIIV